MPTLQPHQGYSCLVSAPGQALSPYSWEGTEGLGPEAKVNHGGSPELGLSLSWAGVASDCLGLGWCGECGFAVFSAPQWPSLGG